MTILITHRLTRKTTVERYDDLSEALARYAELRWSNASQLVMYDAVVLAPEVDDGTAA